MFVRYKYAVTVPVPNDQVYGMWRIGDLRYVEAGMNKVKTPIYQIEMEEAVKTMHEFAVPAAAIAEDNFLSIAFYNSPALNRTTIIPEDLEILYKTGSFTENYIRGILMILPAVGISEYSGNCVIDVAVIPRGDPGMPCRFLCRFDKHVYCGCN